MKRAVPVLAFLTFAFMLSMAGCGTEAVTQPQVTNSRPVPAAQCALCKAGQTNHPGPHRLAP
jgi:hypothetical protein